MIAEIVAKGRKVWIDGDVSIVSVVEVAQDRIGELLRRNRTQRHGRSLWDLRAARLAGSTPGQEIAWPRSMGWYPQNIQQESR